MDDLLVQMGQRMAVRRKKLGLKQEQLAEMVGVTPQTISTAETGVKALRAENIVKVCEAMGVSTDYLLLGVLNGDDRLALSERISKLKPEQYRRLEVMIETFIDAVEEREA